MRKVLLLASLAVSLTLGGCFKHNPEVTQTSISIVVSSNTNGVAGPGQTSTITAIIYDQKSQGVQWSASPLNFGTLSNPKFDPSTLTATVTYTAPTVVTNPTKVTVTATSITDPNVSASVSFSFSPITVTITQYPLTANAPFPFAPQTLNPSDQLINYQLVMNSTVSNDTKSLGTTWSLSPTGVGFMDTTSFGYPRYTAPPTVSAPTTVVVTATSVEDPTVSTSQKITILPANAGPNVVILSVDGGPLPGHVHPNAAFTSLTLCNPGSVSTCQTVDGILVDTGSYGLRILQSAIPQLSLPAVTDPVGRTLENCASWPDGSFLWGPVSTADLYIGGEPASSFTGGLSATVQVISSTPVVVPAGCSNGATASDNTPQLLGANGILGIGPEPTDCTVSHVNYCDGSNPSTTPPNLYYSCPGGVCGSTDSPVTVPASLQVGNPVPLFVNSTDNNGVILQLPAVSDPQASAVGTLTFGINTEVNNGLGNAQVFTLDANDNFTTILNGQLLTNSFIDSGSPALRFPDSLPACTVDQEFYCPTSPVKYSATNVGKTQGQSTVNFTVEDADSLLFAFGQDSVFPTIAGPSQIHGPCSQPSALCVFDWGLPFFYGRKVYVLIDGQGGPWWAY